MAVLTEEQSMLKDQAHAWVRDESPVAKFRQLRDGGTPGGFEPATWTEIAAMGWTGILFASALVGASALLLGGNESQKQNWLPGIAAGSRILTLAVDEGPHHAPEQTALKATSADDGYCLNGNKVFVFEGATGWPGAGFLSTSSR